VSRVRSNKRMDLAKPVLATRATAFAGHPRRSTDESQWLLLQS
jgi:hypothetical protein